MNVNPNVLLRDMIEATARLEQQFPRKTLSKHEEGEEGPLKSQAVRAPTEMDKGISKETYEKIPWKHEEVRVPNGIEQRIPNKTFHEDPLKHEAHPWKNQPVRVPIETEQGTLKSIQANPSKHEQAVTVGWVGSQQEIPVKTFVEKGVLLNSETARVPTDVKREIPKTFEEKQSKHEKEVPWNSQVTRVPTDVKREIPKTFVEKQSKHEKEVPWDNQTTRVPTDVEKRIPIMKFQEYRSKHDEHLWSSQTATVRSDVEEGILEGQFVESIHCRQIRGNRSEVNVVASSKRVNPLSVRDGADGERSPGEAVENATKLCTKKRALCSMVLLIFVGIATAVIALNLLKNDDPGRKL